MDHIQTHSTSHGGCVKGQQNHFHSIHIHFLLHSLFYNYWHARREQRFSRSQEVEIAALKVQKLLNRDSKGTTFFSLQGEVSGIWWWWQRVCVYSGVVAGWGFFSLGK